MQKRHVEVVVLGAGTAGLNAVAELEKAGADWLLVEAEEYGTTCASVGCMPSKLLIAAAETARCVRDAGTFGVMVGDVAIDARAVFERVRRFRDEFVAGVVRDTRQLPAQRRMMGRARFVRPGVLAIGDEMEVSADAVVIAVGSSPFVPPEFSDLADSLLDNESIFELNHLPASLAVIGAGAIGLELGQALAHLGVAVSLFNRTDQLGIVHDEDLQQLARVEAERHMTLHLSSQIVSCTRNGEQFSLQWRDAEGDLHEDQYDQVLLAAGRRHNLPHLQLAKAGIEVDERGRPDWNPATTQCGDHPVFIAGDASSHRAILHEAGDEGRIAGQNAVRWPDVEPHDRRTPLGIIFSDPQQATVGASPGDSETGTGELVVATVSYERQGRARVINQAAGAVKLYADCQTGRLLGAQMLCPRAENMAHLLALAIEQKATVQEVLKMPIYHPVLEEGLRTGLRKLARQLKDPETRCEDQSRAPGD